MVDMMNWFLEFFRKCITLLFSMVSIDGYSFGYMILGALVVGVVVLGTVGAVGILARSIQRYSDSSKRDKG